MLVTEILESLIQLYFAFTSSYGLSIILLSLTVCICLIPLDLAIRAYQNKAESKKSLMLLELDKLKDVTNRIEKHYYTKIVYKQFNYNPLYDFIPAIKILVQLPFLIAAYHLLISYSPLNGVSFGFLNDLSKSHGLSFLNSIINPLPVLMTLISLTDIYLNKGEINQKQRIIISVTSLCFFVILYDRPSAIILYWLTTNIFSFLISSLIRNESKDRLGSMFLKNLLIGYSIVKSNLHLFNLLVFNALLIYFANKIDIYLVFHGIALTTAFVLVLFMSRSNKLLYKIFSIAIFSVVIIISDNVFVPYLTDYLGYVYLIALVFIALLFFRKSFPLTQFSNLFILLNCTYLMFSYFTLSSIKANPKFTAMNQRTNLVSEFIAGEVEKRNNVLVVVLDGYPSKKVLSDFGVRNNLDSIFNGYVAEEFNSNHISTPISLTNLFFDVKFKKDEILSYGQNEERLFYDAYVSSTLFPIDTMWYDDVWHSLVKSSSSLGFSYWESIHMKSKLYRKLNAISFENKILTYNSQMLNCMQKDLGVNSQKNKFIVYHFLTFHHGISIQDKVDYANDIISSSLKIIPKDYSVLFFSDHGLRDDSMSLIDKKSAIFYARKGVY